MMAEHVERQRRMRAATIYALSAVALALVGVGVGLQFGLGWGLAVPGAMLWAESVLANFATLLKSGRRAEQ